MTQVRIRNEQVHADGGYVACYLIYGQEFAVHFVAGKINIFGVAGQQNLVSWKVQGAAKAVRKYAAERMAELPTEWHVAHAELYAEELA